MILSATFLQQPVNSEQRTIRLQNPLFKEHAEAPLKLSYLYRNFSMFKIFL